MAGLVEPPSPSWHESRLPVPQPAQLRAGNPLEIPRGPVETAFLSPYATPQGSPSKKQPPPGSHNLPAHFDSALKLSSYSTSNTTNNPSHLPVGPGSPLKNQSHDYFSAQAEPTTSLKSSSPGRRDGKENYPPTGRNPAAFERQKVYSPNLASDSEVRRTMQGHHLLSAADRDKLAKPGVKRMANLTQLCKRHP